MKDENATNPGFSLLGFFGNPAVGIAGLVLTVIGIILSVYFYRASIREPELTYCVHPAKAAVVRTDQTSRLMVRHDGQEVKSDISAAQVAFWNAGSRPIRNSEILSPLVIRTGNKERILEATIRRTNRDVAGIVLNPSRLDSGEVEIDWDILERDDGGVVQIIFVGDEKVDIQAHAIVEGQSRIMASANSEEVGTPAEQYERRLGERIMARYMSVVACCLTIVLLIAVRFRGRRREFTISRSHWAMTVPLVLMIGVTVLLWVITRATGPPFGF